MTAAKHALIEQARKLLRATVRRGRQITSPDEVRDFLLFTLALREQEVFGLVLLDNQNRVLLWRELFQGTISYTPVYPREVVKLALNHNAAAVIFAHYVVRNIMRVMCPILLCSLEVLSWPRRMITGQMMDT
ncbi:MULTISPECIES: JAB domain-containing protein [Brenneria]|uniref:MPN domain-containing protein n=1 Tax=Brenneria nigrifluens DSM 30175 = ATCC 13028 TaxID=1121120 RepID=A0A2U1UW48_9GAMM|nr:MULTISPECIES: JAB domain-containing protein [Brenneria]EHD22803.1 DNA repair protein RadC [Brenneria sp. EniD312]PWC25842.1 hypothetical protein DDT54_00460 [Brenneria nigrifluens DSM 30175 = ATCC 13028]QCR05774.1 hypothetical protein EH206_17255 [Brenneria nigrifluens DSM 30175 = ATCC 13028]